MEKVDEIKYSLTDRAIENGDQLRNQNCFDFLHQIAIKNQNLLVKVFNDSDAKIYKTLRAIFQPVLLCQQKHAYKSHQSNAYGDQYTIFLDNLEKLIISKDFQNFLNGQKVENSEVYQMIVTDVLPLIFKNPNQALERTYEMIAPILEQGIRQTSHDVEHTIRKKLQRTSGGSDINTMTPNKAGSVMQRMWAVVTPSYKPHHDIGLTSVRQYNYNRAEPMVEIRSGTMAQRSGFSEYNPIFAAWIRTLWPSENQEVCHVYFNNLALDRSDPEGKLEVGLTCALHSLEDQPFNNIEWDLKVGRKKIAVITLPAEKHRFEKSSLTNNLQTLSTYQFGSQVVYEIAHPRQSYQDSSKTGKDFYMSPAVHQLIFGDKGDEIVQGLFENSLKALGLSGRNILSPREANSLYFHFIKYELTKYILEKLQPSSYQMSCKHGIDRGGVSSAYYHLMRSLAIGQPLSKEEFERGLHAAPTMVQGRGMNTHSHLIWAAIDLYISNEANDIPKWLIVWRDDNALEYKNTLVEQLQRLDHYIETTEQSIETHSNKSSLFKKPKYLTKDVKLEAAKWLRENAKKNDVRIEPYRKYKKSFEDANLKVIFDSMVDRGYFPALAKVVMLDRLDDYIESKPRERNVHSKGPLSNENKVAAAKWLSLMIVDPTNSEYQMQHDKHIQSLQDGDLGKIFDYLTEHGFIPASTTFMLDGWEVIVDNERRSSEEDRQGMQSWQSEGVSTQSSLEKSNYDDLPFEDPDGLLRKPPFDNGRK